MLLLILCELNIINSIMAKTGNKKTLRTEIEQKLADSFPDIKTALGDKKFLKKIKKAGKILASGAAVKALKKVSEKTETAVVRTAKRVAKKPLQQA